MKNLFFALLFGFGLSSAIHAQAPENDLCAGAIDLSNLLGQGIGQLQSSETTLLAMLHGKSYTCMLLSEV